MVFPGLGRGCLVDLHPNKWLLKRRRRRRLSTWAGCQPRGKTPPATQHLARPLPTSWFGPRSGNVKPSQKRLHNTHVSTRDEREKVKTIVSTFPGRLVPLTWSLLHLLEGKGHILITSVMSVSKKNNRKMASGSADASYSGFVKTLRAA